MSKPNKILVLLQELRTANPVIEDVFLRGSCMNLFFVLRSFYPEAQCYYNQVAGHCITKIGGTFYDIRGEVENVEGYQLLHEIYNKYTEDIYSYKQGPMYDPTEKPKYCRII